MLVRNVLCSTPNRNGVDLEGGGGGGWWGLHYEKLRCSWENLNCTPKEDHLGRGTSFI